MKPEPSLRAKTKRGLIWGSIEAGSRFLLQFVVIAVLARLLAPPERGQGENAIIVVGITAIFSQLGVGPALVQRRDDLRSEHLSSAFTFSVIFGLVAMSVLWLLAPAIGGFFKDPLPPQILRYMAIGFPISAVAVVSESLIQRNMRFDLIARAEIFSFLSYGALATMLAAFDYGVWALVWAHLFQLSLKSLMFIIYARWIPRVGWDSAAARELVAFSGGITVARIANYLATNGDNLVVGAKLGDAAVGFYGTAYKIMVAPATLIGQVLEKVLFPAMSRVQDDNAPLARVYRQGIRLLALAMLPASAAIFILAPELVAVLLGDKWQPVGPALQILAAGLLFRTSMKLSNSLIRAKGAVTQMAVCQILYMVAVLIAAIVGCRWGIEGVSWGVLGAIFICFIYGAAICHRLVGIKWTSFLIDHVPGILLAAIVLVAGLPANAALKSANVESIIVLLGTGIIIALAILIPALFLPNRLLGPDGAMLREKAKKIMGKVTGGKEG
jgi:O-antigen/teichoic acid export membrane protein